MDLTREILKYLTENNTGKFIDVAPHLRAICPNDDVAIRNTLMQLLQTTGLNRDNLIAEDTSYYAWHDLGNRNKDLTIHNARIPIRITLNGIAYYNNNYKGHETESTLKVQPDEDGIKFFTLKICPITGEALINPIISQTSLEYTINYNHREFTLKLVNTANWFADKDNGAKQQLILQAMLYNNEWPIEKETLITPKLIEHIVRFGDYPKTFEEKLNYFVLNLFANGGNEYKEFSFSYGDYLKAYAENEEEFSRIVNGILSRGLAENGASENATHDSFDVILTEKGLEFGTGLNLTKLNQEPKPYAPEKGPRLMIISTKEDDYYHKKLTGYVSNLGFNYSQIIPREDISSEYEISSASKKMHGPEIDYVIFLSSAASDINTTYRSILDIAIQVQNSKQEYKFFYVSFVDDAQTQRWPRLTSYDRSLSDFRLINTRRRIVAEIQTDWSKRELENKNTSPEKKFDLPVFELSKDEKFWLEEVYQSYQRNEQIVVRSLLASHWGKVAKSFNPSQIDKLLLSGDKDITLLGIWQIHPESDLFDKFDDVVFVIQGILSTGNKIDQITSEQVIAQLPHISVQEVYQIFLQMNYYNLGHGIGHKNDFTSCSILVGDEKTYNAYRNYNGLKGLMADYLRDVDIAKRKATGLKRKMLNAEVDIDNPHSFKTAIAIKDRRNINPVIGVTELAKDLAEIINTLHSDKGQMIGIFGKWGRGKTFLLTELWKFLEKEKSPEYIKIEYHAWKYQETPASWAYLYELFADTFLNKPKTVLPLDEWLWYFWRLLRLNFARLGAWPVISFFIAFVAGTIAITLSGKHPDKNTVIAIPVIIGGLLYYIKLLADKFSTKARALIKKYTFKYSFKQTLGLQADVQEELMKLLKVWISDKDCINKRILLIVEDIDRCKEERVIEIVDALRVMLEEEDVSKRVVIVAAIDERILKNNIAVKYKSLLLKDKQGTEEGSENNLAYATEEMNLRDLISEYLDKAFILAIKLGELDGDQRIEILKALLKEEIDATTLSKAAQLIKDEKAKQKLGSSGLPVEVSDQLIKDEGYQALMDYSSRENDHMKQTGKSFGLAIRDGDFAVKDGDFALEDEGGNLTSTSAIYNQIQNRLEKQNKFEKLTPVEVNLMIELVQSWDKATPRRIRIFYYRYLLCKNMLVNKYSSLKKITIWQDERGMKALFGLLLHFTKLNDPTRILEEKVMSALSNFETIPIPEIDTAYTIYREDYLHLLEVLELVIAY